MPQTCCADSCSIALSTFNVNLYFQHSVAVWVSKVAHTPWALPSNELMPTHNRRTWALTLPYTHLIPCILLKTFVTNSAVTNITPHSMKLAWNLLYFNTLRLQPWLKTFWTLSVDTFKAYVSSMRKCWNSHFVNGIVISLCLACYLILHFILTNDCFILCAER